LAALPTDETGTDALWAWLLRLEEAAADAMHDDWTIDALEVELARLGPVPCSEPSIAGPVPSVPTSGAVIELSMTGHRHPPALFATQARADWAQRARGKAYWYAQADAQSPVLLHSNALTGADLVARLLGTAS
jgi:type VI secretion system protein ImpM